MMMQRPMSIQEGMPLWAFAPTNFNLKAFELAAGIDNAVFLCENIDIPRYMHEIQVGECVLKTHYTDIWDLFGGGESRGYLIKLKDGVKINYLGKYALALKRITEIDVCPVTEWEGDWLRIVEGDNGAVIFNGGEVARREPTRRIINAATRRMDIA